MKKSTDDRNWSLYYAATRGRPPRPTLLRALHPGRLSTQRVVRLPAAPPGRRAIDLGCGTGRDTLPLLVAGWHVLAIDAEPEALAELETAVPIAWRPRLVTRIARFERCHLPAADLVNASFSLITAERWAVLDGLFRRIHAALAPGGRFAGQLLAPGDSWVREKRRVVGLDRAAVRTLLRGFRLDHLEDEEADTVTPRGRAKHWHLWHINAVRH